MADDYESVQDRISYITNACRGDVELKLAVLDDIEDRENLFNEPITLSAIGIGMPGSCIGPY